MVLATAPQRLPARLDGIYAFIMQLSGILRLSGVYVNFALDIWLGTEDGGTGSSMLVAHGTVVDANSVCLMPSRSFEQ